MKCRCLHCELHVPPDDRAASSAQSNFLYRVARHILYRQIELNIIPVYKQYIIYPIYYEIMIDIKVDACIPTRLNEPLTSYSIFYFLGNFRSL